MHTTIAVRDWPEYHFRNQVISWFTAQPWPAKSPKLSMLDYWFWSLCLSELKRFPPNTLEELKEKGEILADSLTPVLRKWARVCQHINGAAVEVSMSKIPKEFNENEE